MAHLLQHLFEDYDNDEPNYEPNYEPYTDNIPSEPLQEHLQENQLEPPIDIKQLELKSFSKCELSLPPQEWKKYIDSSPIQLIIKTKNKYNSFYKKIMKLRRKTLNAKYARKLRVKEGTIKQQFKELTKENKKLKPIIKHLLLKT